jgi:hypothetical protein
MTLGDAVIFSIIISMSLWTLVMTCMFGLHYDGNSRRRRRYK